MNQSATIKLFLVTGSPNGLRTAELSNWSGKAIAAPRSEVKSLLNRGEVKSSGVYILTGEDVETGDPALYIGEAENVSRRLKKHAEKDFWNAAVVFVSKDENLTKAHVRYLEGMLISRAKEAAGAVLMNATGSGSKLPESDAADMDVFMEKCLQLLPVLGVSLLSKSRNKVDQEADDLQCKIKGLVARGQRTETGFVVYQGSQAVLKHRASATTIRKKREQLISKGILEEMNGHFIFSRDIEFGSPSTAAGVVRGGSTNGLIWWKNAAGVSLKELES